MSHNSIILQATPSIVITDPNYDKVSLLMGMDTIPFEDMKGHTVINQGVTLANGIATYGGAAEFDGLTSCLRVAGDAALSMGTGDFTQEVRVRLKAYPAGGNQHIIFSNAPSSGVQYADNTVGLNLQAGGNVRVQSSYSVFLTGSQVIPLNQEVVIAISRIGGSMYLFIDGQLDASGANSNNYSHQGDLVIGKEAQNGSNVGQTLNGYIDEIRITKGLGRYNTNHTPPASFLS